MKNMKKLVSLLLALVMTFAMTMTAFAEESAPSITIVGTEAVPVKGKTFTAYKILDLVADGSNFAYSVPSELRGFYLEELGLDDDYEGNIDYQVYQLISGFKQQETYPNNLFDFATRALTAAKSAHVAGKSETGTEELNKVVISGLEHGYYVIEDTAATTPVSALMLDTTNPTAEIFIKADKPTIEKKIDLQPDVKVEGNTDLVDYNNAAIGDSVSYVLSSKVPDMTGYKKYFYIVTDTFSEGLTYNPISLVIKVGNTTLTADDDYVATTSTVNNETVLKIVFDDFIQYKENKGEDIVITYNATVNEKAVIGISGNPNKVKLEYSNNPNVNYNGENEPGQGEPPVGVTPEDITYTYVTELIIDKENSDKQKLAGAEFTLTGTSLKKVLVKTQQYVKAQENETGKYYWALKDGTYTETDPSTEGINTNDYVEGFEPYLLKDVVYEDTVVEDVTQAAVTGPDGKITFTGLSEGTYTITEIKAPTGYNLLPNPITVVIDWTAPTQVGVTAPCTWTYSKDGATSGNTITVLNQTGAELPSTGGIGTTLFYVAGTIMMFGAAVMMVSRKRQEI